MRGGEVGVGLGGAPQQAQGCRAVFVRLPVRRPELDRDAEVLQSVVVLGEAVLCAPMKTERFGRAGIDGDGGVQVVDRVLEAAQSDLALAAPAPRLSETPGRIGDVNPPLGTDADAALERWAGS